MFLIGQGDFGGFMYIAVLHMRNITESSSQEGPQLVRVPLRNLRGRITCCCQHNSLNFPVAKIGILFLKGPSQSS